MTESTTVDGFEYVEATGKTRRQTESAWTLIREAAGGPREWAGKIRRLVGTARTVLRRSEVERRIARLERMGFVEQRPTALQFALLGVDMLRYFIEPGARDYYASRGIGFGLHQVLRVLDDPAGMLDPVGLHCDRDSIIGHVLQVTHANPVYDFQLLEMFEDGMDEMEKQTAQMLAGTHERQMSIGAVVEDPGYHARLLGYIQRYRKNPKTTQMRRKAGEARKSLEFLVAEETFGALPPAFRYATRLPTTLRGAIAHVRSRKSLDLALCEPQAITMAKRVFAELEGGAALPS